MNFKIVTLGCKVNIYESEAISYDLINRGWIKVDLHPDVQIINTCTVTNMSDAKSRKLIRQLIRENPKAITVVMGCYAQVDSKKIEEIEGVNIIIGTNLRNHIYELVEQYKMFNSLKPLNKVSTIDDFTTYEELKLHKLSIHTRGFIKIQDGCENFCTYCAIPYARGKIKSRKKDNIIEEVQTLVKNGVQEIVLSGINTGSYGRDLTNYNLANLLDDLIKEVPNLYRIRLSSIELKEISDELLNTLKLHESKIAHHFHIPLQSGSNTVLKRMNRKYQMDEYFSIINKIRELFPDASITTDCLAGFVGETEEEFRETFENIKKIGFMECHIFPYSKRPNTLAFSMPNHLDEKIIKERAHLLQQLSKQLKFDYYQHQIKEQPYQEVLFENLKDGYWLGHTSNYLDIMVKDNGLSLENNIKKVKLIKMLNNMILGEIVNEI